jgi:hypothetical protein
VQPKETELTAEIPMESIQHSSKADLVSHPQSALHSNSQTPEASQ